MVDLSPRVTEAGVLEGHDGERNLGRGRRSIGSELNLHGWFQSQARPPEAGIAASPVGVVTLGVGSLAIARLR